MNHVVFDFGTAFSVCSYDIALLPSSVLNSVIRLKKVSSFWTHLLYFTFSATIASSMVNLRDSFCRILFFSSIRISCFRTKCVSKEELFRSLSLREFQRIDDLRSVLSAGVGSTFSSLMVDTCRPIKTVLRR